MFDGIVYHGRLVRRDGRPVVAGQYALRFSLHATPDDDAPVWFEELLRVPVGDGGPFGAILGTVRALPAELFEDGPRWLAVRGVGEGAGLDGGPRVPVSGGELLLAARLRELEQVEGPPREGAPAQSRLVELLAQMEGQELERQRRADRLRHEVLPRLAALDDDETGRITQVEDRLDDIDGPDGDIVDLVERMERLESRAPELFAFLSDEPRREELTQQRLRKAEERVTALRLQLEALTRELEAMRSQAASPAPALDAEALGAVRRSGDVMSGGLVINRGGLEVLSGGIASRGANVSTLEASTLVRAAKLIADAVEVRGDLTFDGITRVVQTRLLEGRLASARRDGPLGINTRGGAEVVVGNAEGAKGLQVFGTVRATGAQVEGRDVAVVLEASDRLRPGYLARLPEPGGRRLVQSDRAADPRVVGPVSEGLGLVLGGHAGSGFLPIAVVGVVDVMCDSSGGPIDAGTPLCSAEAKGHARRAGDDELHAVFGRALTSLEGAEGLVSVVLQRG